MSSVAAKRLSPPEYLERERAARTRSEYFSGEVFAMAGGSANHSLIAMNFGRAAGAALEGRPCRVYGSDLKVSIPSGLFTYPDGSIVCGEPAFLDDHADVLLNPIVLVEVLSPSTEAYDRGTKFQHYGQIPSLRAYVLAAQDRPLVEIFVRNEDGSWTRTAVTSGEIEIRPLRISLPLSKIYNGVDFPPTLPLRK